MIQHGDNKLLGLGGEEIGPTGAGLSWVEEVLRASVWIRDVPILTDIAALRIGRDLPIKMCLIDF